LKKLLAALLVAGLIVFSLLLLHDRSYDWGLPEDYPAPRVPADNAMSDLKVALGRRLFYDPRLSRDNSFSCGTCHRQRLAFTDGRARAIGVTGQLHPRSAMSLVNAAYASRLTWANPLLDSLEVQALTPMFGEEPVEMGMGGREREIIRMLQDDAQYRKLLPRAFSRDRDPYSILNVTRSIAAFVRSIVSFDSPYDRYLQGDPTSLGAAEQRGMALFFSERLECFHCHGGFNFTDSSSHSNAAVERVGFHNTGLYNVDGEGAYPAGNTGLHDVTGRTRDMGRFRAPTLRNIGMTAPYMHDGSIATLDEVIDHYARAGRSLGEGPFRGDGSRNPYKSEFIVGFSLAEPERADLLAFLHALTDTGVLNDPAWSDPFAATAEPAGAGSVPRR